MKSLNYIAFGALVLMGCEKHDDAKKLVRELLVDSNSAEFSDVYEKNTVVCGFINSKNRMGGYTGARPFIVNNGIADVSDDIPSPQFINQLSAKCDERVFDRFSRTFLNKQLKAASVEADEKNAPNH